METMGREMPCARWSFTCKTEVVALVRRSDECLCEKTRTDVSNEEAKLAGLLKRAFGPATVGLGSVRVDVGYTAYTMTWEGSLYLATVIDLASRRVAGWAMATHSSRWTSALSLGRPLLGSEAGPPRPWNAVYPTGTSVSPGRTVASSRASSDPCWDGAVAESRVSTLKRELILSEPRPERDSPIYRGVRQPSAAPLVVRLPRQHRLPSEGVGASSTIAAQAA